MRQAKGRIRPFAALALAMLLLLYIAVLASAQEPTPMPPLVPEVPYSPWGAIVTRDGAPAQDGFEVAAWIGGVQYITTTTRNGGWYALDVPGDDPQTATKEGGVPGEVVTFRVQGYTATPTGTWQAGSFRLDLTVPAEELIPEPGSLLLLGAGLAGLAAFIRSRRR